MKTIKLGFIASLMLLLVASCSSEDDNEKDLQKPTISINYDGGFPKACEVLTKGET